VLVGKWDQIPFDVVSKLIERKNIAKPGTLQLLEHATVSALNKWVRTSEKISLIFFNPGSDY